MLYINPYFLLDTEKRKVFDENRKELYLSGIGNAYHFLEFLCEKYPNPVKLEDINYHLDRAKFYKEDYIRQLRNNIKRAVSRDVVEYKNGLYSIVGELKKVDETVLSDTETERLDKNQEIDKKPLQLERKKNIKKVKILLIALSIICILIGFDLAFIFLRAKNKPATQKPTDEMILIPAGEFIMGSTEEQIKIANQLCQEEEGNYCTDEDYSDEYPQHKVSLVNFYIDKKEVSNEDYKKFIDDTKHGVPLYWDDSTLNASIQPVVGVNWYDAKAYCEWAGKRLPTEEEWEKTARGIDGREWSWGNEWDTKKLNHGTGGLPGYDENDGYLYTNPVGMEIGVSPYGVLNIAGNVAEWSASDFNPYPGNDKFITPNFNKPFKIIRGGGYVEGKANNRAAVRFFDQPEYKDQNTGFRCAKDAS